MDAFEKIKLIRMISSKSESIERRNVLLMKPGSVVEIRGRQFLVKQSFTYHEKKKKGGRTGYTWKEYQLVDLSTFEEFFLDAEDDDGLSCSLTLKSIPAARISEVPGKGEKAIEIDGFEERFYLDEKCLADFTVDSDPSKDEEVLLLDYESGNENTLVSVEKWGSGDKCYIYQDIELDRIKVTHI